MRRPWWRGWNRAMWPAEPCLSCVGRMGRATHASRLPVSARSTARALGPCGRTMPRNFRASRCTGHPRLKTRARCVVAGNSTLHPPHGHVQRAPISRTTTHNHRVVLERLLQWHHAGEACHRHESILTGNTVSTMWLFPARGSRGLWKVSLRVGELLSESGGAQPPGTVSRCTV